MSLLLSDGIGAVAGLLLAIPPLRDQYGRFCERRHSRQQSMTKIHGLLRSSLKKKREEFENEAAKEHLLPDFSSKYMKEPQERTELKLECKNTKMNLK